MSTIIIPLIISLCVVILICFFIRALPKRLSDLILIVGTGLIVGLMLAVLVAILDYAGVFPKPGLQIGRVYYGNSILAIPLGVILGSVVTTIILRIKK